MSYLMREEDDLQLSQTLLGYRVDRNLHIQVFEPRSQAGRVLQEISEFLLEGEKDIEEEVDALCDVQVFARNAIAGIRIETVYNHVSEDLHTYTLPKAIVEMGKLTIDMIYNTDKLHCLYILNRLIDLSNRALELLGYCPYKCMVECIKEISSRMQDPIQAAVWAETGPVGKWEKDKKQDPSTLYIANYSSCFLNEM